MAARALGAVAAQRWKTQINENAKAPAFFAAQPELCHNEIVGWGQHGDVSRQVITLVTLRQSGEHPQVARRFDLISEIMLEVVADVVAVWAEGTGPLAQFFDLVLFGDFVSLHLAGRTRASTRGRCPSWSRSRSGWPPAEGRRTAAPRSAREVDPHG